MSIVLEEADESAFWIELFGKTGIIRRERSLELLGEANEQVAIFGASLRTSKAGSPAR